MTEPSAKPMLPLPLWRVVCPSQWSVRRKFSSPDFTGTPPTGKIVVAGKNTVVSWYHGIQADEITDVCSCKIAQNWLPDSAFVSAGQIRILGVFNSLDMTLKSGSDISGAASSIVPPFVTETRIGYLSSLSSAQIR